MGILADFPMKTLLKFLFVVVIGFIIGKGWFYIIDPATLPIKRVKIVGSFTHIKREPLQSLLRPYLKTSFLTADFAELKRCVLEMPWVQEVRVERIWPDTVIVHISEQQAIARWGNNELLAVSGALFRPPLETFPKDLPVLQGGNFDQPVETLQTYRQMLLLLAPLHESIVSLDGSDQDTWCLTTTRGTRLLLSKMAAPGQLYRFIRVYGSVLGEGGRIPNSVDLRYPNGFSVKW